jgi:di/tricarboxylate transporter
MQIWAVAAILVGCMILFVKDVLAAEIVAILAVLALIITRILTTEEAFSGFGDPSLIIIASVFVLSAGLVRTGVVDFIGRKIEDTAGKNYIFLLALTMIVVTTISAFINNVAATAVMLPVVLGISNRTQIHPGKFLMPIAFGSMLGGTCTAIGTSTNVVMSSYLTRNGMAPFTFFEFAPVGLIIAGVGILYMVIAGHRVLPAREDRSLQETYRLREYISEVVVLSDSPLIGKTIQESRFSEKLELNIISLIRGEKRYFVLRPDFRFQANDLLIVEGSIDNILKVKETYGIEIKPDFKLTGTELEDETTQLAEILITPMCDLTGQSLKEVQFRQRYNLVVLAIHRGGHAIGGQISQTPLQLGDILLVQGRQRDIDELRFYRDFLVLQDLPVSPFRKRKARTAILIFFGVILASTIQSVPIVVAVLIGALLMILSGCLTVGDAYHSIHWPAIVLIGGMTALGLAMQKTGVAAHIGSWMVQWVGNLGPTAILGSFFLLTVLLTQPMSNAAASLLVAPIAFSAAIDLQLNPRAFIMTIALAASASFITPLEPACALVYSPGKYKFTDFPKCGVVLTILVMAIVLLAVPRFWPLK